MWSKKREEGAGQEVTPDTPVQNVNESDQGDTESSTQGHVNVAKHQTDGMSHFRRSIAELELSEDAEDIVLSSWTQVTIKQYETYTTRWVQYSSERNIDPYTPTLGNVINFLTTLYNKGLGYSALNTAKSALSTFISIQGHPIGNHPLVKRFLKRVFQRRPALPKNRVTWDPQIVLRHLEQINVTSLKNMPLKTVVLLALLTGQRTQSIHFLDIRNISISENCVKLRFGDLLKQSRPGFHQSEITLEKFPTNEKSCMVTTLKDYIQRTEHIRKNVTHLFLSYQKPHQAISQATISRWIKLSLQSAGVDMLIFTPHSTRSASTSAALRANIPLKTILNTAGWNNSSTFERFYNKPLEYAISCTKTGLGLQ